MNAVETLDAVMRDAWPRVMTGGLEVRIVQDHDRQTVLLVGDEHGCTRTPLNPPLTDTRGLVEYIDGEIQKALAFHRQLLRHYPQVTAADEMEYLA